ncbi:MAG TPA: murein transglycosylase A [Syntrophales bacterium]|nr:murein transglycosylase A [Syntrophales bacterium]HOM07859.1 murein transglycosylase A [Syntrophales bacterium]HOO00508.1 murein transglycosylase A [Syntrophales bacterium]HPQ07321.1 murein transglycosylase A [Syntrophales bacterium]
MRIPPLLSVLLAVTVLALGGCAGFVERPAVPPVTPSPALVKVEAPPDLTDDLDLPSLLRALDESLAYYRERGDKRVFCLPEVCYTGEEMASGLRLFKEIMTSPASEEERRRAIRQRFDFYRAAGRDGRGEVIFTGYFEPILAGSLERTERFRYPLYGVPPETVTVRLGLFNPKYGRERITGRLAGREVVPHYSRREIDTGKALAGRGLEIAWTDDPVALFFLHIQGSGILRLPDGSLLRVGYAGANGRPFRGLTGMMVQRGLLGENEKSYRRLKAYLEDNPATREELMNYNESYVFFRVVPEGPLGALGRVVVAHRSIATDLDLFPPGALALVRLHKPLFDERGEIASWRPFSRFVLNHDAGGAIKGPGRVDLFCGTGPEGEMVAGSLNERGELYFLVGKREGGEGS